MSYLMNNRTMDGAHSDSSDLNDKRSDDVTDSLALRSKERTLLALPAEVRTRILEYIFADNASCDCFQTHGVPGGLIVNEDYTAAARLSLLLTCRQIYSDGSLMALSRTNFIVTNLFSKIPERLSVLQPKQIEAVRSITFVADNRHFRRLLDWGRYPFGMSALRLDVLNVALHRSSFWHYLFDFTADIVRLLRQLKSVRRLVFVRNAALVKGSFKTWYNRLVGLIMKTDHFERYEKPTPNPEKTWWSWSYDEVAQTISLEALPPKPLVDEETYMQQVLPLIEELRISMENEEWNPDPRARNHYY